MADLLSAWSVKATFGSLIHCNSCVLNFGQSFVHPSAIMYSVGIYLTPSLATISLMLLSSICVRLSCKDMLIDVNASYRLLQSVTK